MTLTPTPIDILLRLSLVEGVTALHLPRLIATDRALPFHGVSEAGGPSLLRRAWDALVSERAAECAEGILETCAKMGIRVVPLGSEEYPRLLRDIPDAPLILYQSGCAHPAENPVAIVGSRAPTAPGKAFAGELAEGLSAGGWTVVSGMARGIDTAAHEGALRGGGTTLAVLGCGIDVVYPPEAGLLRARILAQGSLLSEYPPGSLPLPRRFPARNRIISGFSRGVIVAEAPARSGALITARFALDQGREVMAVPGNPLFPHTAGSNRLLREGATPVTGVLDVTTALGWSGIPAPREGRERRILDFLSTRPRHVDDIAEALDLPVPDLLPCLLDMEIGKLLERRAGDYYKKCPSIKE